MGSTMGGTFLEKSFPVPPSKNFWGKGIGKIFCGSVLRKENHRPCGAPPPQDNVIKLGFASLCFGFAEHVILEQAPREILRFAQE